jgi:exosortase
MSDAALHRTEASSTRWRRAACLAAPLVLLTAALYWPVLRALAVQWQDDANYSHGFLIPLIAAYFVYERRRALEASPVRPGWGGFALAVGGVAMLLLGSLAADLFLQRVSLIVMIAGLVWLLAGRAVLHIVRFPLLFLLFMIPLPAIVLNAIALPLQGFAAQAATATLEALSIPVLREGHVINLANTTLEVAEACSGIRSLVSLLAVATVFAYFTEPIVWKRAALIAAAVPVAIVANACRVAGTGVLAHAVGPKAAQGFYHDFSGWLVFVVAFVLLVCIGTLLRTLGAGPPRAMAPTAV